MDERGARPYTGFGIELPAPAWVTGGGGVSLLPFQRDATSQGGGKNWTTRAQGWTRESCPRSASARGTGHYYRDERVGKASVLKAFEDLGYYCVDNLPVGSIPQFAELAGQSSEIERTALVVDVREGTQLEALPEIVKSVRRVLPTKMIFLEAADSILLRRFSETRRPHPLGTKTTVKASLAAERQHLRRIRAMADLVIDTSKFNVHELRSHITERFQKQESGSTFWFLA